MREHDYVVAGEVDIGFESVCADVYGGFECRHCVLWVRGFIASMRDCLWKSTATLVLSREGP